MATKSRSELKNYFQTGDKPSQAQYADLIDSFITINDDTNLDPNGVILNENDRNVLATQAGDKIILGDAAAPLTINSPITASGGISASSTIIGDTVKTDNFFIENVQISYFAANDMLKFGDNVTLGLGSGPVGSIADVSFKHDGSDLDIFNITGDSQFRTSAGDVILKTNFEDGNIILKVDKTGASQNHNGVVLISGSNERIGLDVRGNVTSSGNISSSSGTGSFGSLKVDGSSVDFSGLPTSDPGIAGRLYNDSGTIKISL